METDISRHWQTFYTILHIFSMALQADILLTKCLDFLKQINILKSFNPVLLKLNLLSSILRDHSVDEGRLQHY